jgi:hypothetical protein
MEMRGPPAKLGWMEAPLELMGKGSAMNLGLRPGSLASRPAAEKNGAAAPEQGQPL